MGHKIKSETGVCKNDDLSYKEREHSGCDDDVDDLFCLFALVARLYKGDVRLRGAPSPSSPSFVPTSFPFDHRVVPC